MLRWFPAGWDRRKVSETRVALYHALVGALFWAYPITLQSGVYAPWKAVAEPRAWGGLLLTVVTLHFVALWLNGRAPRFSTGVRALACVVHIGVALAFAAFFFQAAAYWGTVTYTVLVIWPLIGAVAYTIERANRSWTHSPLSS